MQLADDFIIVAETMTGQGGSGYTAAAYVYRRCSALVELLDAAWRAWAAG